jgi:hypothetical protein
MKNQIIVLLLLINSFFISCSKDSTSPVSSRAVRYEITGNFTGTLTVVYTAANGSVENVDVNTLPWKKELTANNSLQSLSAIATGSGGKIGQTATLKIIIGNVEAKTGAGTANNIGFINLAPAPYLF